MSPLRVLVVDDEPLAVERLQRLCGACAAVTLAGVASSGREALDEAERLKPDLALLDIGMAGLDGMVVARRFLAAGGPAVIFTTAFESYAAEAFDVAAVDYLLKPVGGERLALAIDRAVERLSARAPANAAEIHIWAPYRGDFLRLRSSQVEQVSSDRDYVHLQLDDGRVFQMLATMHEIERRLRNAPFLRVHRSAMVRTSRIAALTHLGSGAWAVRLVGGASVRVSRSRLADVRRSLGLDA